MNALDDIDFLIQNKDKIRAMGSQNARSRLG